MKESFFCRVPVTFLLPNEIFPYLSIGLSRLSSFMNSSVASMVTTVESSLYPFILKSLKMASVSLPSFSCSDVETLQLSGIRNAILSFSFVKTTNSGSCGFEPTMPLPLSLVAVIVVPKSISLPSMLKGMSMSTLPSSLWAEIKRLPATIDADNNNLQIIISSSHKRM